MPVVQIPDPLKPGDTLVSDGGFTVVTQPAWNPGDEIPFQPWNSYENPANWILPRVLTLVSVGDTDGQPVSGMKVFAFIGGANYLCPDTNFGITFFTRGEAGQEVLFVAQKIGYRVARVTKTLGCTGSDQVEITVQVDPTNSNPPPGTKLDTHFED
jgi:hypothetical protein